MVPTTNADPDTMLRGAMEVKGLLWILKFVGKALFCGVSMAGQVNYNGFISYGLYLAFMTQPMKITFVVMENSKSETWPPLIQKYKCQAAVFYAPQLPVFIATESFKTSDLSSLETISTGGSYFSKTNYIKVEDAFKKHQTKCPTIKICKSECISIEPNAYVVVYSSTEMGFNANFQTPFSFDEKIKMESVGKPTSNPDYKYRIRHVKEKRICEPYEEGEIEILSPCRMFNYWHNRFNPPIGWVSCLRCSLRFYLSTMLSLKWAIWVIWMKMDIYL